MVDPPDTWHRDAAALARPGNDAVQLARFADDATDVPRCGPVRALLRERRIPLLAVRGRHDEIFGPAGATALAEAVGGGVRLVEGEHVLLESALDEVTDVVRGSLGRVTG